MYVPSSSDKLMESSVSELNAQDEVEKLNKAN